MIQFCVLIFSHAKREIMKLIEYPLMYMMRHRYDLKALNIIFTVTIFHFFFLFPFFKFIFYVLLLFLLFVLFSRHGFFCSPGCTGTSFIYQASLKFTEITVAIFIDVPWIKPSCILSTLRLLQYFLKYFGRDTGITQ